MTLPEDRRQLLLVLNAQEVEYLVVGGRAAGSYSEPRSTKDIDIFIRSEVENTESSIAHRQNLALRSPRWTHYEAEGLG